MVVDKKQVEIYTDGACRGNPGPGGWAVLMRYGAHEKELSGAVPETTNNRMELQAVIAGLKALKRRSRVKLTTDSQYVQKGITEWLPDWKARNWRTSGKKPVKNEDLWRELDESAAGHEVSFEWVRGHSGHPENERVDQLANAAIDAMLTEGGA
jgi:ribonuclease HI